MSTVWFLSFLFYSVLIIRGGGFLEYILFKTVRRNTSKCLTTYDAHCSCCEGWGFVFFSCGLERPGRSGHFYCHP